MTDTENIIFIVLIILILGLLALVMINGVNQRSIEMEKQLKIKEEIFNECEKQTDWNNCFRSTFADWKG